MVKFTQKEREARAKRAFEEFEERCEEAPEIDPVLLSAELAKQQKKDIFYSDKDARSFESKLFLSGFILTFGGLTVFIFYLAVEPGYAYFMDIAAFGLFAILPLGVVLILIGFLAGIHRKRRVSSYVDASKKDPIFSDSCARLFTPNLKTFSVGGDFVSEAVPVGYMPQFIDENKQTLKFPTLMRVVARLPTNLLFPFDNKRSLIWRKNRKKGIVILAVSVLIGSFAWFYYLTYDHPNLDSEAPWVIGVSLIIAIYLFRKGLKYPGRKDTEPKFSEAQYSICASLSHAVIDLQGGSNTQAFDAVRIAPQSKRAELIDCLFDRQTGAPRIQILTWVSTFWIKFTLYRGLRLMTPLDREVLRAIFHCFNLGHISEEDFTYQAGSIILGQRLGMIEDYKDNSRYVPKNVLEEEIPLQKPITEEDKANFVMERHLLFNAAQANDSALQLIDRLYRDNPKDPQIRKIHESLHNMGAKWMGEH